MYTPTGGTRKPSTLQRAPRREFNKSPIRNVRRYSLTLYTAAHCTPRSQEAKSKYTESEKRKEPLRRDSLGRMRKMQEVTRSCTEPKAPCIQIRQKKTCCTKAFFCRGLGRTDRIDTSPTKQSSCRTNLSLQENCSCQPSLYRIRVRAQSRISLASARTRERVSER